MNKAILSRLALDFCLEIKLVAEESSGVYAEIGTTFSSCHKHCSSTSLLKNDCNMSKVTDD